MTLAIKGHTTRGKEVIELLEMLGGKNELQHKGSENNMLYIIKNGEIHLNFSTFDYCFKVFTIEEFLEKFPYKVGDKVIVSGAQRIETIEGMSWRNDCEVIYDTCYNNDCVSFYTAEELQPYKEETMEEQIKIDIPKGYEFDGVDDGAQQVVFTKIQPKYPKTFIEVLNFWHPDRQIEDDYQRCYKKDLIEKFQDLLYARDAYWKIAGEQMGLGKSWDSKYGCGEWGYWIGYDINENKIYCQDSRILLNRLLVFPTEEMRDAFFENFKELIESCKELL